MKLTFCFSMFGKPLSFSCVLPLLLLSLSSASHAEDDRDRCRDVLSDGTFDYVTTSTDVNVLRNMLEKFYNSQSIKTDAYRSIGGKGGADVSVPGLSVGGSGSFEQTHSDKLLSASTTTSEEKDFVDYNTQTKMFAKTASSVIASAWAKCMELKAKKEIKDVLIEVTRTGPNKARIVVAWDPQLETSERPSLRAEVGTSGANVKCGRSSTTMTAEPLQLGDEVAGQSYRMMAPNTQEDILCERTPTDAGSEDFVRVIARNYTGPGGNKMDMFPDTSGKFEWVGALLVKRPEINLSHSANGHAILGKIFVNNTSSRDVWVEGVQWTMADGSGGEYSGVEKAFASGSFVNVDFDRAGAGGSVEEYGRINSIKKDSKSAGRFLEMFVPPLKYNCHLLYDFQKIPQDKAVCGLKIRYSENAGRRDQILFYSCSSEWKTIDTKTCTQ